MISGVRIGKFKATITVDTRLRISCERISSLYCSDVL